MKLLVKLFILSYLICNVCCESQCNSHKLCGQCVGNALEQCVWCAKENFTEIFRCQPTTYSLEHPGWCEEKNKFMINSTMKVIVNKPLDSQTQLRPQLIKIRARPGDPINFDMFYRPADQFPLDVYILMDFSYTMRSHKEALDNQVEAIFKALQVMTKNVQIGVGSFVEKPGFPYADVMIGNRERRQYAYAFKNHLSLTSDMTVFKQVVGNLTTFGSNYEDPECTLDALMQVMACEKEINWRNRSRRIVVVATDSTYHSAGDGKMIGAVKPNDMMCHIKDDEYKAETSLVYDYPSVSQINKVAAKGKFNIIFAAVEEVQKVYEDLSKQIMGANYAVLKKNDHDNNIVKLIEKAYQESVQNVQLDYSVDSIIGLDIACQTKTPTDKCKSTPNKMTVQIPATIIALQCPPEEKTYNIVINQQGISDKLTIELDIDCRCQCEKGVDKKSNQCNSFGDKVCGVCKCDDNRSGDTCELDCSDEVAIEHYKQCYAQNNASQESLPCSNRGQCRCGKCDCKPGFSGKFCEYNDLACEKHNGHICAGNGECKLEKCQCFKDWAGDGCECPLDPKYCIGAFSNKICSGRGECKCGKCHCNKITGKDQQYLGAYCDSCDDCSLERCDELKDYVRCNFFHNQEECDKVSHQSNETAITVIKLKKSVYNSTEMLAIPCQAVLDDGKILVYKYDAVTDSSKLRLIIQDELEPAVKVSLWVVIGSVVGGILLIGILFLITGKFLIDKYDAREYEKFCESAKAQGYDVSSNPLYRDPHVNIINPLFSNSD